MSSRLPSSLDGGQMMPNLLVACSVTVIAQGNGNEQFVNQPSENEFDRN